MTSNHMAHPLLISLTNIDASVCSKTSLHGYLLLGLLPIVKFHKDTCIHSLMQDHLTHEVLNKILSPLKTAATVGIMMSDPTGNLHYCFTPLASWMADTPEESLLAGTSSKASPVTMAMSKQFRDPFRHPARMSTVTLAVIQLACDECSPLDYKEFKLKIIKRLGLNGMIELFWKTYPLSDPSEFLTPEVLHHFHRFFWDHDMKWCITAVRAAELDFHFSLLQTAVGYRAFADGISTLKQVTGCDHHVVQRYIVGTITGSVPRQFLIAIRALLDFRYKAQAPVFTDYSLADLANSLQEFHDHKDTIVQVSAQKNSWGIPKLELLQSVISSI